MVSPAPAYSRSMLRFIHRSVASGGAQSMSVKGKRSFQKRS